MKTGSTEPTERRDAGKAEADKRDQASKRQTRSHQDTRELRALSQWTLGGFPWPRASGPHGPVAGPALFTRAGLARTGECQSSLVGTDCFSPESVSSSYHIASPPHSSHCWSGTETRVLPQPQSACLPPLAPSPPMKLFGNTPQR